MRYHPPSIKEIGLSAWLDSQKEIHNGFGYKEFVVMVETHVSVSSLARAMNVQNYTIRKWINIYKEEQA